ncbi:AzlD domain-containing protein [Yinghuangia seranimata]|uniref:AzlD domain-containing protein n=1 Tax=Yinghuangia seranimata TaxID=408067 RepID=UPI00248B3A0E|nr:AzlD domain-containing protein [Yinghuangia seranimata]MDI2129189.1 AzlD domain-containing protein [Yinghuangia seranimata]
MLPLYAIAALAAGTFAFRLAGPVLHGRVQLPDRAQALLAVAATVLLTALVASSAVTQGHGFAGYARPAGVAVAGVLVLRRAPFPLVVIAAAATTAVLRLLGVA